MSFLIDTFRQVEYTLLLILTKKHLSLFEALVLYQDFQKIRHYHFYIFTVKTMFPPEV